MKKFIKKIFFETSAIILSSLFIFESLKELLIFIAEHVLPTPTPWNIINPLYGVLLFIKFLRNC